MLRGLHGVHPVGATLLHREITVRTTTATGTGTTTTGTGTTTTNGTGVGAGERLTNRNAGPHVAARLRVRKTALTIYPP